MVHHISWNKIIKPGGYAEIQENRRIPSRLFSKVRLFLAVNFLQQFIDGGFQLGILALDDGLGGVQDVDVGSQLGILQVGAVRQLVAHDGYPEDEGRILYLYPVHAGHCSRHGSPDQLT